MTAAIRVENISKKYLLRHQVGGRSRYVALRDVLADKTVGTVRRLLSGFKSQASGFNRQNSLEEFWALQDVSFEIKQGEAVGIIGRNGAGKSTLLKILSRITKPTTGRIEIEGRVASLLEVGTGFHPELTGRENIFLNGAILGMHRAEIRKKFDEIVAFAEVEKFLDTPVKHYSSGMYMRLAFAVAAHLEPEILIVDEVLAVGDVQFQKKCLGKMQDVSQQHGRTVLFVSHNLDAILRLCTHVIWLDSGKLKDAGNPAQTINAYLQRQQSQGDTINLSKHPRADYSGGTGRFLEISPATATDGTGWSYPFGAPFAFDCTFEVSKKSPQFSVAFAVFAAAGFEIASARAPLSTAAAPIEPGKYRLFIETSELRLVPGSYTLNLGMRSEAGDQDYIDAAACFDVTTNESAAMEFADSIRAATIPKIHASLSKLTGV